MEQHPIILDDNSQSDDEKGAVIGGIGGALMGAVAGSPLGPAGAATGMVIGAIAGAGISGVVVREIDRHDHDGSPGDDGRPGEEIDNDEGIVVAGDPSFETRARRLDADDDTVYQIGDDDAEEGIYRSDHDVRNRSLFDTDDEL